MTFQRSVASRSPPFRAIHCLVLLIPSSLRLCILSGSMEPAFQRGDILFLNNQDDPIRVGEIVVFKIKDRDIPIVHRVLEVHEK